MVGARMDEDRLQMNCDCCGGINCFHPFYEPFWECEQCGVFRNKNDLLEGGPPDTKINTDWSLMRGDIEKSARIIKDIERYVSLPARLYDVAGSYGYLVWAARLNGWASDGQDIDTGAARAAKEMFDIDICTKEFESLKLVQHDCFVFNHGIEHLRSPQKALQNAIYHLTDRGVIYLAHPVMPDRERAKDLMCNSHQHEWTLESFRTFLVQFHVNIRYHEHSDFDRGGVPSQIWIVGTK